MDNDFKKQFEEKFKKDQIREREFNSWFDLGLKIFVFIILFRALMSVMDHGCTEPPNYDHVGYDQ